MKDKRRTFRGKLIEQSLGEDSSFFLVRDTEQGKEYKLPKEEVLFPIDLHKEYSFFVEFIAPRNKEFISVMHPDFLYDSEKVFQVEAVEQKNGFEFFRIKSRFSTPLTVRKLPHQNRNQKRIRCYVYRYKKGKPQLRNRDFSNHYFQSKEVYSFEVQGFSTFKDKKGIKISSVVVNSKHLRQNVSVRAYPWHIEELWKYDNIYCEVIGLTQDSTVKLRIVDERHPYFSVGKTYEFTTKEIRKKTNGKTGETYFVLVVSDQYGFDHDVTALPNQERKFQEGVVIDCVVKGIDTKVRLSQVNIDDPFYSSFDEIIDEKRLQTRHFDIFISSNYSEEKHIDQLRSQYSSSQAFWVFTYCNSILPSRFRSLVVNKNYKDAHEVNLILMRFENWILNEGILRAFRDEEERKIAKKRAVTVLENCKSKDRVLSLLISNKIDDFLSASDIDYYTLRDLYHFTSFCDLDLVDAKKVIAFIDVSKDLADDYLLERTADLIELKKQRFIREMNDNYFVLLKTSAKEKEYIDLYKSWTFVQYLLYSVVGRKDKRSLALAKLFRFSVKNSQVQEDKVKLLSNAYNILENQSTASPVEIDDHYAIQLEGLRRNPNLDDEKLERWKEIEDAEQERKILTLRVLAPHHKGYRVEYHGILGFLPYQNIKCRNLKNYRQHELNWEITAHVVLTGKSFGLFVVKQLPEGHSSFVSRNLKTKNPLAVGEVVSGVVKNIVDFGVFISTDFGDGLIHLNNLDDEFNDKSGSLNYFLIGETVYARVLNIRDDGKLEFGFKQLVGTRYEQFYNKKIFGNFVIDDDFQEEYQETLQKRIEIEKGHIIEQFAVIQNDLDTKVKYIRLSKQFFSNTNNAKSYLLNIYIEYFQRLKELDSVIEDYSIDRYEKFSRKIQQINIQERTLDEFPEAENLVVFIEILGLFNNTAAESYSTLFELVQKYSILEEKKLLSVLSKTTLANNLMMSEALGDNSKDQERFSLRNLKIIRNFIENGVFSVARSKEDKLALELEEKRAYWLGKISQDEGEGLEFKSTLITPVPDEQKKKILEHLHQKLSAVEDEKAKKGILSKIDEIKGDTAQKRIIHSAFKTIAAFANTNGGTLLLGVSDDKTIYGLEKDYDSFSKLSEKNRDGFGKFLDNKLKSYFGDVFSSLYLKKEFLKFSTGDILIIRVEASDEEVFLMRDANDKPCHGDLYVRNLSSTDKLEGVELSKFIRSRTSRRIFSSI